MDVKKHQLGIVHITSSKTFQVNLNDMASDGGSHLSSLKLNNHYLSYDEQVISITGQSNFTYSFSINNSKEHQIREKKKLASNSQ